jgi:hypothetical protein
MSRADQAHRVEMRSAIDTAGRKLGLTVTGEPVFGWRDRSIGVRAYGGGGDRWLRVVAEQHHWAYGDFWTGNADSTVIQGIHKPEVLRVTEWDQGARRLRAEVMTFLPGEACSATAHLDNDVDLAPSWWSELRRSVDKISGTSTQRQIADQAHVDRRLRVFFADEIDPHVERWTTAHGDLHWANLLCPQLGILDWELWGRAPAGYDAATLYCYSLLSPATARKVHAIFADLLDAPDGIRAQLYVITRLLLRAEKGDHASLVLPVHRHARWLLR